MSHWVGERDRESWLYNTPYACFIEQIVVGV